MRKYVSQDYVLSILRSVLDRELISFATRSCSSSSCRGDLFKIAQGTGVSYRIRIKFGRSIYASFHRD